MCKTLNTNHDRIAHEMKSNVIQFDTFCVCHVSVLGNFRL